MNDRIVLKTGNWTAIITDGGKHLSFDGLCVDDGGDGVDIDNPEELSDLIALLLEAKAKLWSAL